MPPRGSKHEKPARRQDAVDLIQQPALIRHVFQHVEQGDRVELLVAQTQPAVHRDQVKRQVRASLAGGGEGTGVGVGAGAVERGGRAQRGQEAALAAAEVEVAAPAAGD